MISKQQYPTALPPPSAATTVVTSDLVELVIAASRKSPRKRIILPLHKSMDAPLHRMLNGLQPNSYIQPHRHLAPPKAESVLVLKGAIVCFIFNDKGGIEAIHHLAAGSPKFGIDSEPGVFHTFVAIERDTVLFEVKPGPYGQSSDKDFATWAPAEGTEESLNYMKHLYEIGKKNLI